MPRRPRSRPAAPGSAPTPAPTVAEGLRRYREKRDFAITPEPPPGPLRARRPGAPLTFMVHKHDARRLHYDLRLEIEGALASWALPHGPSYDPDDRRLAVETEDHPLEYGAFEGRIPDGEYGAGDTLIWDRGTWDTDPPGAAVAMRKKGHIAAVLSGRKLLGKWHLVRTRPDPAGSGKAQWLFFKAKDDPYQSKTLDVTREHPASVLSGRVITRGPTPVALRRKQHPEPIGLLLGLWPPPPRRPGARRAVRALAAVSGKKVTLQNAEGRDLAAAHPEVVAALMRVEAVEAVIDGDLAAGRFEPRDLLWLDGRDLRAVAAGERRDLLASVVGAVWHSRPVG